MVLARLKLWCECQVPETPQGDLQGSDEEEKQIQRRVPQKGLQRFTVPTIHEAVPYVRHRRCRVLQVAHFHCNGKLNSGTKDQTHSIAHSYLLGRFSRL